jgi:hypothetical protein
MRGAVLRFESKMREERIGVCRFDDMRRMLERSGHIAVAP